MPRGAALGVGALPRLLLGLGAALAGACTSNQTGTGGCQVSRQAELPATPLTMLSDARLATVGDGYMLTGISDRGATVRWAPLDGSGAVGQEQSLAITAAAGGPWLSFTSDKQPGDTLLVAQGVAQGAAVELRVTAVPAGAPPAKAPAPGPALAVVPGASAVALPVAVAATRTGAAAVVAWADPDPAVGVRALTLSPTGQAMGPSGDIAPAAGVTCMGFAPGKKDLTLIYYRFADPSSNTPTLVIHELVGGAAVDSTLELVLDSHDARCPQVIATAGGYAVAFQDGQGSWMGTYLTESNRVTFVPFFSALAFGGADVQPPIVGLMTAGPDHGVVFSRVYGGELWRIGPTGSRLGVLPFPTAAAHVGAVSTQVITGGLLATYADYTSFDAGFGVGGKRIFLGATCP